MSRTKQQILYIATILFSILFLWGGYSFFSKDAAMFRGGDNMISIPCRVDEVLRDDTSLGEMGGFYYKNRVITFRATAFSGEYKGQTFKASQSIDNVSTMGVQPVEVGDKIYLHQNLEADARTDWVAGEYYRFDKIAWLCIIFLIGLLLFGRRKGINTILSLTFTCLAVFLVFVPAILAGYNAYLISIIVCLFIIAMTLCLVSGFSIKSLSAALGCTGGVLVAGILTVIMGISMKLTGYLDDNTVYVSLLNEDYPISLTGIIFAANIIGAVGATMDVSMSISSSLREIIEQAPGIRFRQLVKSGFSIGRDIMGTMSNTLILAYISSSLTIVLLFTSYQSSLGQLLNRESIIVELLQALSGSIGILLTIPFTVLIASALYLKFPKSRTVADPEILNQTEENHPSNRLESCPIGGIDENLSPDSAGDSLERE